MLSFFTALDLFIFVVPTDALVITTALVRPKRWIRCFLWISCGTALGAVAQAALLQWDGTLFTERLFPGVFQSEAWKSTDKLIDTYGAVGLAVSAITPVPQQIPIALAAFAGMPLGSIFVAALVGRLLRYGFFAWSASHAPSLLKGFRAFFQRKSSQRATPVPAKASPDVST